MSVNFICLPNLNIIDTNSVNYLGLDDDGNLQISLKNKRNVLIEDRDSIIVFMNYMIRECQNSESYGENVTSERLDSIETEKQERKQEKQERKLEERKGRDKTVRSNRRRYY